MRYIGRSDEGVIVEFYEEEYQTFLSAVRVAQNRGLDEWPCNSREKISSDMKEFLVALEAFIQSNLQVEKLGRLVDSMRDVIKLPDAPLMDKYVPR